MGSSVGFRRAKTYRARIHGLCENWKRAVRRSGGGAKRAWTGDFRNNIDFDGLFLHNHHESTALKARIAGFEVKTGICGRLRPRDI
jgi:hypothetical protein